MNLPKSVEHQPPVPPPALPRSKAALLWQGWRPVFWRWGPLVPAALFLLLGYLHYAPGTDYSLSAEHYRAYAFPAFRYSDLIWLYLRDGLADRPLPYLDYPLEYPPLTGLLSYLLSWAPDLPTNFAWSYLVLAACGLGTVAALRATPGANPWVYAGAPALFFYTGHQWDPAAIFSTALALCWFGRKRDRWGAVALAVAVSLKLFPLAFVAAVVIDRLRRRRFRDAVEIGAIVAALTVAVNLSVALADYDGWSFFFRWNRDRLADSGIWVLWRGVPTPELTRWSGIAAVLGGAAIAGLTLPPRGLWRRPAAASVLLPLGASFLLWWLFVNKTFTTHLILWVFLALALIRPAWWLWLAVVAVDLVGFQVGNYLNLYNIPEFQNAPLIRSAVENIYDPLQLARSGVLLAAVGWGLRELRRVVGVGLGWAANGRVAAGMVSGEAPTSGEPDGRRAGWAGLMRPTLASMWAPSFAFAGFVVATVALTWPYARHLGDSTLVGFDPLLQIWLSEWIQHALATNPAGLYDSNIFYPFAQTLAYTDANIPGALLAWPPRLVTGDPLLTNSLLTLATFPLAAAGMSALVVHLTGNRAAGFVAGLAYAFLPFRLVHLWHLNWLEGAWLPWLVLALLRLLERPSRGRALLLGLLAAVQVLTSFYFALQIGLVAGLTLLAVLMANARSWGWAGTRRRLRGVTLAAVVALALAVPFLLPYLQVRAEQGLERSLEDAETYKAGAESYLTLAPWDQPGWLGGLLGARPGVNESLSKVGQAQHADGHRHQEIVIEDALFPGTFALLGATLALVLVVATFGLKRVRRERDSEDQEGRRSGASPPRPISDDHRLNTLISTAGQGGSPPVAIILALAGTALVASVLSFGPSWGPKDGSGVSLPYRWLFDHAPFFTAMRVPARLGGVVGFALVAMAGLGAAWGWARLRERSWLQPGRRRRLVAVALTAIGVIVVAGDLAATPIPLERVDRSTAVAAPYEWLAAQAEGGAVMEFPAENIFLDPAAAGVRRHVGLSMFWSTRHWRPLVNGSSGFIPLSHVDLLDAFTGEVARADGSRSGRISHVEAGNVALLRQLGVRWLVVHRDQYRAEDWPAVEVALAGTEATVERVGEFGEVLVYRVRPPLGVELAPRLTLYAPTLLTPDARWAPTLIVAKPGDDPAILALTRPATLTTTWYDVAGRQLWRGERRWPLPTIVGAELIRCVASGCEGVPPTNAADYPAALPAPESTGDWRPTRPGHYVVRLELAGDREIRCTVDVDLVDDADAVRERAPDEPWRWAACGERSRFPTNNPGAVPFRAAPPSVTFVGGQAAVETTLATRRDEEVQTWFLLAPPGATAPWAEAVYRSPTRQRLVRAGEPATFEWSEPVAAAVAPGVYGLTIWFHRRVGDSWEHAEGGGYGMAPVVVRADGTLRWAGPIRLSPADVGPPRLVSGRRSVVGLGVAGTSDAIACRGSWRLLDPAGAEVAGGGTGAGGCARPQVAVPGSVAPGRYRLEIVAEAIWDGGRRAEVSDALSWPVVVRAGDGNEAAR